MERHESKLKRLHLLQETLISDSEPRAIDRLMARLVVPSLFFVFILASGVSQAADSRLTYKPDSVEAEVRKEQPIRNFKLKPSELVVTTRSGIKTLNLSEIDRLESVQEARNAETVYIPEGADTARSKDDFVRITAQYHLKRVVEERVLPQLGLASDLRRWQDTMAEGLSYEVAAKTNGSEAANGESMETAQETTEESSSQDTAFLKKVKAYFDADDLAAHFLMEGQAFKANLFHEIGRGSTVFEVVMPKIASGDMVFRISPNEETKGSINYQYQW